MNKLHGQPCSQLHLPLALARCLLCELMYPTPLWGGWILSWIKGAQWLLSPGTGWRLHVSSLWEFRAGWWAQRRLWRREGISGILKAQILEPSGRLLGSRQNYTGFHANVISKWSALGHWGLLRGDEGYGLTSGDGEPEYVTQPSLEWPKRVSVGQRRLHRFPELSLQECVVGTALFKRDNQERVTL